MQQHITCRYFDKVLKVVIVIREEKYGNENATKNS
jgi:hypothetical protein